MRIFFALKNPTASAGFEPANLGTKGQHATSRPPKPQSKPNCIISRTRLISYWLKDFPANIYHKEDRRNAYTILVSKSERKKIILKWTSENSITASRLVSLASQYKTVRGLQHIATNTINSLKCGKYFWTAQIQLASREGLYPMEINCLQFKWRGHAVAQLVEAGRKVAGSIPDGVTGIFHWHQTSVRIVALGSTKPLREMSTRGCVGLTTLPPSCAGCLEIWEPQPPGTLRACSGL